MSKVYSDSYTLLEGVSLIQDELRYDFAHIPANGDLQHARVIEPSRIPNSQERFRRFCEKSKAELCKATSSLFMSTVNLEKVHSEIVTGFGNAVDKNFPEALTLNEAKEISAQFGLIEIFSKITTEPLLERKSSNNISFKIKA
ncbi:hypothetical protein [Vibrio sp. D431a]|uniref:hypothetical protein n=1 Tax=Vibrio sp. D431a TaxID=2837388 RepID=UPI002556CFF6|nr:hypothetical protein [Vibrio sp. D431a]MDK9789871.1 hypothetical protein [Vibrio sp. D431a]